MRVAMPLAQLLVCVLLVTCSVVDARPWTPAQRLREWAREQNVRNPGEPLHFPAPPGDYTNTTIEALTVKSTVVVVARLSRPRSYVTPNEDYILTDYVLLELRVLAGRLPITVARTPGAAPPLTLTVWGGEVVVEGVPIRGTDHNREAIVDGGEYLLFLRDRRSSDSGYEILDGGIFSVTQGRTTPLLKNGATIFGMVDGPLEDLVSRIQGATIPR